MSNVMNIEEMKNVIKELPEEEAKLLLFHVFLRVNLLKETAYSKKEFVNNVENLFETIFDVHKDRLEVKQEENFQMIHILFGASSAGSLKVALKDLGRYKMEKVISFWGMFSIGPIWQLHEEIGVETRLNWMKNVMNDENEDFHDYMNRFQETINQINSIQEGVPITIWISDSSHEQTGLRFVLYLLKNKKNDILVINTTKKHSELFNKKDIEYTVLHTGEIPPEF